MKGRIFGLEQPLHIWDSGTGIIDPDNWLRREARRLVALPQGANPNEADELLSQIRLVSIQNPSSNSNARRTSYLVQVFSVFDYLNSNDGTLRFNRVRQDIRTQLGYIEEVTGQSGLVNWWNVWSDDFFDTVGSMSCYTIEVPAMN